MGGAGRGQQQLTYTCSNAIFVYSGKNATIQAVCLQNDGTPHQTSLTLTASPTRTGC